LHLLNIFETILNCYSPPILVQGCHVKYPKVKNKIVVKVVKVINLVFCSQGIFHLILLFKIHLKTSRCDCFSFKTFQVLKIKVFNVSDCINSILSLLSLVKYVFWEPNYIFFANPHLASPWKIWLLVLTPYSFYYH